MFLDRRDRDSSFEEIQGILGTSNHKNKYRLSAEVHFLSSFSSLNLQFHITTSDLFLLFTFDIYLLFI